MKDESRIEGPWEWGTWFEKDKGRRTDLIALKERVLKGKEALDKIIYDCDSYQQLKYVQTLSGYCPVSHEYNKRKVYWFYGETGTGKTREAMRRCKEGETYHATTAQWFDGYMGQKYVLIDELRAKCWPYATMLRLLDGYQLRVPIKGGFTVWKPQFIFITTPLSPQETYYGTLQFQGSIQQLLRRITQTKKFEKNKDSLYTPGANRYDEVLSEKRKGERLSYSSEIGVSDLYCDEEVEEEERLKKKRRLNTIDLEVDMDTGTPQTIEL